MNENNHDSIIGKSNSTSDDNHWINDDENGGLIIDARIERSENSPISIIGGDSITYYSNTASVKTLSPNPTVLEKIQQVFIKPKAFDDALSKLSSTHMLLIEGESGCGKMAAAIALGLELRKQKNLSIKTLRVSDQTFLIDFLEGDDNSPNSIYIIGDAFRSPGLDQIELQRHFGEISHLLNQTNNYIVLTTDLTKIDIPINYKITWELPQVNGLAKMFVSHMNYYEIKPSLYERLLELEKDVISTAIRPLNIDRFVKRVADLTNPQLEDLSSHLSKSVNYQLELRDWFSSLELHEKYFVMLASLFENLEWLRFFDIYSYINKQLREEIDFMSSAFQFERSQLLNATNTIISDLGILEFKEQIYKDFALQKAQNDYYSQFNIVIISLEVIARNFLRRDDTDIRIAIFTALGELGKKPSQLKRIENVLEKWASEAKSSMRAAPGYSLIRLAEDHTQIHDIFGLIRNWQKNKKWEVQWAAAAALERMYSIEPDQTIELLKISAESNYKEVSKAVSHAIYAIGKSDVKRALELISKWLDSGQRNIQNTAIISAINLIKSRAHIISENKQLYRSTTEIFKQIITLGNPDDVEQVVQIVNSWATMSGMNLSDIDNTKLQLLRVSEGNHDPIFEKVLGGNWLSDVEAREEEQRRTALIGFAAVVTGKVYSTIQQAVNELRGDLEIQERFRVYFLLSNHYAEELRVSFRVALVSIIKLLGWDLEHLEQFSSGVEESLNVVQFKIKEATAAINLIYHHNPELRIIETTIEIYSIKNNEIYRQSIKEELLWKDLPSDIRATLMKNQNDYSQLIYSR